MKRNLVMLLGMIVFSSLILASVISTRQVCAARNPPWTTDDYDGLWHNADFTVTLRTLPGVSILDTYYNINGGSYMTLSQDSQPKITTEGADNVLTYWSVGLESNGTPVAEPPVTRDGIKLDKTPPTGSIIIGGGSRYVSSQEVTLTLKATDPLSGVSKVRYSNDPAFSAAPWEAYSPTKTWTLSPGNGNKTVHYQIRDNANNMKTYQATITLDTTPPTGSIIINMRNPEYTTSASVTLHPKYSDTLSGVNDVRYMNGNDPGWGQYESPLPTKQWVLTPGDGNKTVYYQIRDNAGTVSAIYSDSIILDTTPPSGEILINGGERYTKSSSVVLTLSATDSLSGISQVRYSNNGTWGAEPWEDYSPTKTWTLSPGDGNKTVHYQVMDGASIVSQTYNNTIILDMTPPTGSIVINGASATTNTTRVTLTLSANKPTDMTKMCIFNFNDTNYFENMDNWQNFTPQQAWTLVAGDGVKKVYVQFKDNMGRFSPIYAGSITLNTTIPTSNTPPDASRGGLPTIPMRLAIPLALAAASILAGTIMITRRRRY